MDEIPFGLERQKTYANLSPNDLESMGKRASMEYLCDGSTLNESVVKLAQEHPSISANQVRRVVEFANQHTFQRLFEKQASDKNVEFDLADPSVILNNLNNGARPNIVNVSSPDYETGPVKEASTVDAAVADLELAREFGLEVTPQGVEKIAAGKETSGLTKEAVKYAQKARPHFEKVAADLNEATSVGKLKEASGPSPYPEANPYGDLIRAKQKLAGLLDTAQHAFNKNDSLFKEAQDRFCHELGQHLLSGGNLGEAVHAMAAACGDSHLVKRAMEIAIPTLNRSGLDLVAAEAEMAAYHMEKGASRRVVNPDSPLVESLSAMVKVGDVGDTLIQSCRTIGAKLDEVEGVLKEAMVRHATTSI